MAPQSNFFIPRKPTPWQLFNRDPTGFLVRWLHQKRPPVVKTLQPTTPIAVVCISDTHDTQPEVPDGDLLLHAGDLTNDGSFKSLQAQLDWLASLPHKHKVIIAGNHDRLLDSQFVARYPHPAYEDEEVSRADLRWHDLIYLHNSSTTLTFANGRKLTIYGSPLTPQYGSFPFQYPREQDVWAGTVPDGADILLTHGPPKGYLDLEGNGCPYLMREMTRVKPRLMVFGHLHAGHGKEEIGYRAVETEYQNIMAGHGGLVALLRMTFWLLVAWIRNVVSRATGLNGPNETPSTIMVNAAVVRGMRDDECQSPIFVQI